MALPFLDRCIFQAASTGAVDFVEVAAVTGFQTMEAADVVEGQALHYAAQSTDLLQWEVGEGTYSSVGPTLSRDTVLYNSLGTTAKINFAAAPQVLVTVLKEDFVGFSPGGSSGDIQYNNAGAFGGYTPTQLTAVLDVFTSLLKGVVPASGGGSTNFLRADGTWTAPSGGGDVVGPASATDNSLARFDGTTGKLLKNGAVIGTDVQAWFATLDSWAAITRAAGFDTFVATPSSANLKSLVTDETGSGALVFADTPTFVTPLLGTPTSGTLTNCTGYPVSAIAGLGTGVATALAIAVGSAGAFVVNGGALGTPSSGTLTNVTGLPSILVANEAADTSCFPAFFTAATGELGPKTNVNLTFNSATGALGVTILAATTIELGAAATDTTLSRVSAGVVAIEGVNILTTATGQPLNANLTSWAAITRATGFDTFVATPTSANLAALVTDETGTDKLVFNTSPGFTTAINPLTNDAAALGTTALGWADLFLASGGTVHFANTDWVATHTTGILTVGTGDLRVTNNFTDATSVVTVGGAQTLTAKSLTSPTITGTPTAATATWTSLGTATTIDINGGTIDGAIIGGAAAAAGTFTTLAGTTIELGAAATDTTLTRVSAGVVAIEGVTILTTATGQPLDADLTSWAGVTRATGFDTFTATPSSANLRALLTDETGTGLAYFQDGALGTPSSGTVTNLTGTASININGTVGATTATTGVFTTATVGNTGLIVGASTPFSDAAGTLTLQNVDALDATTEGTIETAIDTLANLTSIQGFTFTLADAGFDVLFGWDDTGAAYKNFALADITTEAAPAAGDFVLIYGAEGDLRKANWSTLPGGGSQTPWLSNIDANGFNLGFDDNTGILDDSGNEQLIFQKTASAINYWEMTNSAAAGQLVFAANSTEQRTGSATFARFDFDSLNSAAARTTFASMDFSAVDNSVGAEIGSFAINALNNVSGEGGYVFVTGTDFVIGVGDNVSSLSGNDAGLVTLKAAGSSFTIDDSVPSAILTIGSSGLTIDDSVPSAVLNAGNVNVQLSDATNDIKYNGASNVDFNCDFSAIQFRFLRQDAHGSGQQIFSLAGVGQNSTPGNFGYGTILLVCDDNTAGSEDSSWGFRIARAGSDSYTAMELGKLSNGSDVRWPGLTNIAVLSTDADGDVVAATGVLPKIVRLGSPHTLNSATGTEVTGMQFTAVGAGTYIVTYYLLCQSSATGTGIGLGINHTGTATIKFIRREVTNGTSAVSGVIDDVSNALTGQLYEGRANVAFSTTTPNTLNTGFVTADVDCLVIMEAIVIVTVSGDLELWHGSEGAVNTTVNTNSSAVLIQTA